MTIRNAIKTILSKTPALCECGKYLALGIVDGRPMCFDCQQNRRYRSLTAGPAQQTSDPSAMCECGEFHALVLVAGCRLCYNCHDKWLVEHELCPSYVPRFVEERIDWRDGLPV